MEQFSRSALRSHFLLASLIIAALIGNSCITAASAGHELRGGSPGRYNTRAGPVEGKLNVHLVAHSHDDVGWLKTVDQYYIGSNNSIQVAAVQYILDTVVEQLSEDPNRKFIQVEQAFFQRWWRRQSKDVQRVVRRLVKNGQLEFTNGGWCMHDEAATHYTDMVHQMSLGLRLIRRQFGQVPRVAWQIDPFGHSAVQGYLISAMGGFDAVFFARADYEDSEARYRARTAEFVWRASDTLNERAEVFGGRLYVHYLPPDSFRYDTNNWDPPVQDDPELYDYNVQQRVDKFVETALKQAESYRTNHIMWTMGDDFAYSNAVTWFRNMDKLIHYVNRDGRVNAFYSTPSIYVDAKHRANESWPVKTGDFFPYADCPHCYWTGYFSSRPAFKRYVRHCSALLLVRPAPGPLLPAPAPSCPPQLAPAPPCSSHSALLPSLLFPALPNPPLPPTTRSCMLLPPVNHPLHAARQVEALVGGSRVGRGVEGAGVGGEGREWGVEELEEAMAVAQHHDSVSGTAKQHVNDDYTIRLYRGAVKCDVLFCPGSKGHAATASDE
ncbi:unnamed protein product [Closterium sp. NIES-65]|nr:unnamed protein product [Closterium sp. NIES-65]